MTPTAKDDGMSEQSFIFRHRKQGGTNCQGAKADVQKKTKRVPRIFRLAMRKQGAGVDQHQHPAKISVKQRNQFVYKFGVMSISILLIRISKIFGPQRAVPDL